jgi:hypothetical protein
MAAAMREMNATAAKLFADASARQAEERKLEREHQAAMLDKVLQAVLQR